MKQKKQNRILAVLLAVAMMFQMLPMMAFAAEDTHLEKGQAKIGDTVYESVLEAVKAAPEDGSTTTITLGEGEYTLYGTEETANKNLTFVGQGVDLTTWKIGCPDKDLKCWKNADFSFKNSGMITFQDMTLKAGPTDNYQDDQYDYQGFAHTTDTVVKNCVINGKTFYWGYTSAKFENTTFNAPSGDYAIWTYSSPEMTFDGCTFNASGKAIYVYADWAGKYDTTINFENCTVNGALKKPALSINDSNKGSCKYIIKISGNNTVEAARDNTTCSRVFGFGGKPENDTGCTEVYVGNDLVWGKKDGEPKGELKTHKHSDGVKDGNVKVTRGAWDMIKTPPEREVTEKCGYCNWKKTTIEYGYTLVYDLNGGTKPDDAAADEYDRKLRGTSDALAKAPVMEGHQFLGWKINENSSVYSAGTKISEITDLPQTGDITLTAQWEEITTPDGGSSGDGGSGDGGAGVVVAGALLGGAGYLLGTRLWLEGTFGFVPSNRIELAMALWKRADCPAPVSTELYPDIDEDDTDAQAAARWCVEQDLMKDFARTNSDGTQTVKFKPYDYVFRPQSLVKWYKLEKLLNEQQSTNA